MTARFSAWSPLHDEELGGPLLDVPVEQRLARHLEDVLAARDDDAPLHEEPAPQRAVAIGTSAMTLAERLASSTAGLMNITLPVNVRPGTASVVNSSAARR